jgi:hypothetical protein
MLVLVTIRRLTISVYSQEHGFCILYMRFNIKE